MAKATTRSVNRGGGGQSAPARATPVARRKKVTAHVAATRRILKCIFKVYPKVITRVNASKAWETFR